MIEMRNKQYISIGKEIAINTFGHLTAYKDAPIIIGNNVQIGPYIVINTGNHNFSERRKPIMEQGYTFLPVTIEDDVWIRARVTILYGSYIPRGCVIGACSLARRTDKMEPYGVYAGNPLTKIGERRQHENSLSRRFLSS
jgi:virginiamycin A acetyltransferase